MLRLVALSVAAATICPLALAQTCKKPSAPSAPVISKVTAPTFQLTQVSTKKIDDTTSTCLYKGNATLTLTTDDSTATAVPVNIELRTQTTLNKAGDGFTDGVIHQLISGSLVAVNKEFGDLTGVIEGSMLSVGSARVELRVVFHGVFTQDASGAYTLVNVDANGVEAAYPRVGGGKK
jgi:hypothetical protein